MLLSLLDELRKRQKKFFLRATNAISFVILEFADIKVSKRNFLKSHSNK